MEDNDKTAKIEEVSAEDRPRDTTPEETPSEDEVPQEEQGAKTGKKVLLGIVAACLVLMAIAGFALAQPRQTPEEPAIPATVEQELQTTSLSIKALYEGWKQTDGPARVKVKDADNKTVKEADIALNEAVAVAELEPGSYTVELAAPVLADGTVFVPINAASLEIAAEGEAQKEDMATHDASARTALLETSLQAVPEADMTESLIDTAVAAYAHDDAEKAKLKERAMAKMKAYQDKKAEEQKVAAEAAANGTATPEQIAAVEAAGGYVAPESYTNSGYTPSVSGNSNGGGGTSGGSGSTGGNEGGGGDSTPPPVNDRYEGNPKYGYWMSVEKWVCNTCGTSFSSMGALDAHQQESWDAKNNGQDVVLHGGYSWYSTPTWVWY